MKKIANLSFCVLLGTIALGQGGISQVPELKKKFNDSGSQYIKATFVGQFWSRYTDLNPGTTLDGYGLGSTMDIGIRRLRFNVYSQLSDKVFVYVQFGQNNFNYTSKLFTGSFFHDAVAEFRIHPKILSLGTGLTGWSGLTRFAAPGAGSILGVDAPLYQQVTNGINDQFLRKLSIYAKGKIGKLDYRLIVSKPMTATNSSVPLGTLNATAATYSTKPPKMQTQGYINYQFFDQEDNTLGYTTGTYHGKKKILNVGAGWIRQEDALWRLNDNGDTLDQNMLLLGADVFMEIPLSDKRNVVSAYVAFTDYRLGQNYIRNLGVMNPANGVNPAVASLNGTGNALPLIGTGQTLFIQAAYKLKDQLLKNFGSLQIYGQTQISDFQGLDEKMKLYEGGVNWLISGDHKSKLTLAYQSRPVFNLSPDTGRRTETDRKGMVVLQYQVSL